MPTVVIYSQASLPQLNDSSSVSEPHNPELDVSEPHSGNVNESEPHTRNVNVGEPHNLLAKMYLQS